MVYEDRRIEGGRRTLYRRGIFDPNYKGWQRRDLPNRRLLKTRRNSE